MSHDGVTCDNCGGQPHYTQHTHSVIPAVAADKASLTGTPNDVSAQLAFCAKNAATCATLLQQGNMPITFTRTGDNYIFSSGGCDYKYKVGQHTQSASSRVLTFTIASQLVAFA